MLEPQVSQEWAQVWPRRRWGRAGAFGRIALRLSAAYHAGVLGTRIGLAVRSVGGPLD